MGLTRAQARTFAKGTTAAIQRKKDQDHLIFDIALPPHMSREIIIEIVRSALYRSGGLSAAVSPMRVLQSCTDVETLLTNREKRTQAALARSADLTRQLEVVQAASSTPPTPPAVTEPASAPKKWVSVKEAARINRVSETTIRRAIEWGEIVADSRRVTRNQSHLVLAETFVKHKRKPRSLNKKKTS